MYKDGHTEIRVLEVHIPVLYITYEHKWGNYLPIWAAERVTPTSKFNFAS